MSQCSVLAELKCSLASVCLCEHSTLILMTMLTDTALCSHMSCPRSLCLRFQLKAIKRCEIHSGPYHLCRLFFTTYTRFTSHRTKQYSKVWRCHVRNVYRISISYSIDDCFLSTAQCRSVQCCSAVCSVKLCTVTCPPQGAGVVTCVCGSWRKKPLLTSCWINLHR